MIKRVLVMLCCAISSINMAIACDACGCSVSGIGIGLMTDYRSNFVRLGYFNTRFTSSPDHGHHNSTDAFSRMNLTVRYSPKKVQKLRFIAEIPFARNVRDENGLNTSVDGLSDIKLIANYALLNKVSMDLRTSVYVEAGGGVSMPTGQYNENIIQEDNLPENFNLGNGSWGYIFQVNSVWSRDKFGVLINNNYQVNDETSQGYRFGNQFSSQITAFRELPVGELDIIPNLGFLYENISSDQYSNDNAVPETGGEGLFASAALNFKTDRWLAGVSYSLPLNQNYSSGVVDANSKLAVHVSFLF